MLSDEEKKEYEELKSLLYTGTLSQYGKRKLIDIIEKQQKEIEELKDIKQKICNEELLEQEYVKENFIHKDKIKAKIKWYEDFRGSILYEKYNYEEFVKDLQSLLEKE